MRERNRRPAPDLDQRRPLRDGRAQRPIAGVEDLMAEDEGVGADVDHPAPDVQDVADPQFPEIAHVAVQRDAGASGAGQRPGIEADGLQDSERRVLEPLEVVRHREVVDVVDLPPVNGPAVGLEPAHEVQASHGFRPRAKALAHRAALSTRPGMALGRADPLTTAGLFVMTGER